MMPAVTWNVYAWMAWALLVVSIRYAVERRQQQIDEAAALRSLHAPAPVEVAPNSPMKPLLMLASLFPWDRQNESAPRPPSPYRRLLLRLGTSTRLPRLCRLEMALAR